MSSVVVVELHGAPPLGPLSATIAGDRLLRLAFDQPPNPTGDLHREAGGHLEILTRLSEGVARWLATGDAQFGVAVDLGGVGEFRSGVYRALGQVRPGQRITYGELARRSGHPGAARAVGRAMATNPWPLLIPCHRVVPAAGGVGNYAGGAGRKRWMLELEAARAGRLTARSGGRGAAPAGGGRRDQAGP